MLKRPHQQDDGRPPKRLKPTTAPPKPPPSEQIHFARQLQTLLTFDQTNIPHLRTGIASFKAFLESILYHKDEDDRGRQLSILREYLENEKPNDLDDKDTPFLSQLWQAWSFASHSHSDQVVSSVSALFALIVKTLASLLDFRDYGLLLCRTVLQHQHLRLVKRSLEAPRHKDYVVSPVLRLLVEVAGFDGGVCARRVWEGREMCFESAVLRRLLGWTRSGQIEEEAKRRPAIRTLAIRYILTLVKYLHEGGKAELLRNKPLCSNLFHFLKDDPSDVFIEILNNTEQHVLKDTELPRSAKADLLLQHNLERVTEIATRAPENHGAANRAFEWLKAICKKPEYGVLKESGWYPPGTAKTDFDRRPKGFIDLGLDSIDFYDRSDKPVIRNTNTTLLAWIQALRPHSNLQERELVLTCFKSAPELVAAYFAEKPMQLEPKLSNTWIGYASFLFEIVRLPVPAYFGHGEDWAQLPPQIYIMLDSILPRPLTQKVLTRCLNQSSELITFFAVRILLLALEKLAEVRSELAKGAKDPNSESDLWSEASERLSTAFIERCPSMKDVISTFRKLPDDDDHALQQEGITRLLRLFYEILPLQAMEEQFDISTTLTAALVTAENANALSEISQLRLLRLQHLLQIAKNSPGMRWLSKPKLLDFSPIVTLLRIHLQDVTDGTIRGLIRHVLSESYILNGDAACDALVAALQQMDAFTSTLSEFLDNCFGRVNRQPAKYVDDLEALMEEGEQSGEKVLSLPSLLVAVLREQAPFVANRNREEMEMLRDFICGFVGLLERTDDAGKILEAAKDSIARVDGFEWRSMCDDTRAALDKVNLDNNAVAEAQQSDSDPLKEATLSFERPPVESENHPELFKWTQKDVELAIDDGDIAALMLCLSSQYPEIRSQALTQLHKFWGKVDISSSEYRLQFCFLILELIETYEKQFQPSATALPYLVSCFATHALEVEKQPIHFMYPKINEFLNKKPEWQTKKLPTYWLDNTVLSQPEEDDAYWKEFLWVLDWLVDGLRTRADLDILRKAGILERVMALYASPGAEPVKEKVLELVWRVTWVEEGSNTLITRMGVLAWLEMTSKLEGKASLLKKRVLESCDMERVNEWTGIGPNVLS